MAGNDLSYNIGLNTKPFEEGAKKLKDSTKSIDENVKKVGEATKKTTDVLEKGFNSAQKSAGNLKGGLGGVAEEAVNVGKAAQKGGLALKSALISTGVGALIVALGFIVDNWDKISDIISGVNRELEEQNRLIAINADLLDAQIGQLREERNLAKLRGEDVDSLIAKEKSLLEVRIGQQKQALANAIALQKEAQASFKEITETEKFFQFFGKDARTQEQLDAIKQLKIASADAGKQVSILEQQLEKLNNPDAGKEIKTPKIGRRDRVTTIPGIPTAEEQQAALASQQKLFEKIFANELNATQVIAGIIDKAELQKRTNQAANDAFQIQKARAKAEALALEAQILEENINNILTTGVSEGFASIGSAIGDALSNGTNVVQAAGGALLSALGGIIVQLGKQAIGVGIGLIAIKKAFLTLGGIGAIAAGTALVALGTAFGNAGKAASAQMGSGGGGGGASDFSGGGSGVRTSSSTTIGGGNSGGRVVFEIAGDRLIGVLNNATDNGNRILGAESLG